MAAPQELPPVEKLNQAIDAVHDYALLFGENDVLVGIFEMERGLNGTLQKGYTAARNAAFEQLAKSTHALRYGFVKKEDVEALLDGRIVGSITGMLRRQDSKLELPQITKVSSFSR